MNQSEIEDFVAGKFLRAVHPSRDIALWHLKQIETLQSRNAELEARVKELEGTLTIDNYTFQIFKDGSLRISNRSGESMGMSPKLFSERFDEFFSKWF